ncbi:methylmalonyl-CoA mutase [Acidaminobacter sp. JC074]|uniref:methylmalonyl-CoA mutase family protein n=1 Tax=Acidaminobacter sp. JC074 TaxID=2530199 RepID=UPI001F117E75|nr:methylmalonyl-CoA mutase family protein [Acidaminobacter sp. JC074]MCH4886553.1 methylmalonyl-CoA mutase [Acidaminobacter sp. JC074]
MEKKNRNHNLASDDKLFSDFKKPSYSEWQEAAVKLLKGKDFNKAMFTNTPEAITLKPIYNQEDLDQVPYANTLPGQYPYLRGTKAEGHLVEPWKISQEIYAAKPADFNKALIDALYKGQTSMNMTLDMPTLLGLDADSPEVSGIGYRGVSVSTLQDLTIALHDLVFSVLPIHINVGMNPVGMTGMFYAYLENSNQNPRDLKGVLGYDPLGMFAKYGYTTSSIVKSYDCMRDVLNHILMLGSDLRTILVESHVYHNGGADAVSELSYAMATGTEYLREMIKRGVHVDDIAPHMAFSLSLGSNFFMELSKVRAARVMWSKIVESFGGNLDSQKIYIHGKTSSWTKTVYDPYVNMLRNASEAFSGAVGGVDSLEILPFDEPIREADDFSRRVSRNVQSILQDECRFTQPIDPAGGSWYIESLTHEIAENAWKKFQTIEKKGGMKEVLTSHEVQAEVKDKYEEKFKNMAKRKHVWVGTNMYANMSEEKLAEHEKDVNKMVDERIEAVQSYHLSNDMFEVENALSELGDYININNKISMPLVVKALQKGVSLGLITELLSTEEEASIEPVSLERGAERFEALRDKTKLMKAGGKCPKVFLFNYGKIPKHKPRADFSRGFFEVGGFEILTNDGFLDTEKAVKAGLESGAQIGVICSTDHVYPEIVPAIAKSIRTKGSKMILIVAGRPTKELIEIYKEAGINHFIYMGADCYELLTELQKEVENA